ncbi:c-type cytochrome [Aurantimonas sp. 22II-16-19i]|uniref:c-type cytochrome n=1 Tax=Aurantimonas sp. 22II-16-19i TaxID=1317114 RepID=UPI0009F7B10A|nr:c-type cytochrome [Aurantimonas sp. 22II-16-19i]ORE93854.1 cytochrome c family protein [Aurantimonas sp. 22II-16-19i]
MRSFSLAIAGVALVFAAGAASAQDVGDPAAGEKVFNKCKACHAVGEGAKNKIGPELNGIVGDKPGADRGGYKFSKPFQDWAADKTSWNQELMSTWLADPRGTVKGTKMAFAGIKKPDELSNVIAYLATFDENGGAQDPAEALKAAAAK